MKGLLWLLAASALAVALALALRGNDGYALFVLHPWRAEISLNLLAVLLIVAFAAGYFLVRMVWHTLRLPSHVRAFREGRRDQWLERAKEGDGDWRVARLMTTAELLLEERRFDEARAVLRELNASGPRDVTTLLLLLRAEQGLANWDEVVRIAKSLEKLNAMPQEAIENIRVNANVALFSRKALD